MSKSFEKLIYLLAVFLVGLLASRAAEPTAEQIEFFESKVRPIFADNCYTCHSGGREVEGRFAADSAEALLKGGDSGPTVIPEMFEGSLLIKAVRYTDPDLKMPPKNKKLSAEQIGSLEAWVKMARATRTGPINSPPAG